MKRAIDKEQKEVRRRAILDSALSLFEESGGTLSTVAAIADRSGIGKGTIYLYFRTREEIYLALLEEYLHGWFDTFEGAVGQVPFSYEKMIEATCFYLGDKPAFMRLASIFNGILEKNVDYDTVFSFKRGIQERLLRSGRAFSRTVGGIKTEMAVKLILRSFSLAVGLWQFAEPAPIARQVLEESDLDLLKIDFIPELKEALAHLWAGAAIQ